MLRPDANSKRHVGLITLLATGFALSVFYFSLTRSFRLPELMFEFAWQLNFDRTATIFSAGFAIAMSSASNRVKSALSVHLGAYFSIVLAATGLVVGLLLSWPHAACVFMAFGLGTIGLYVGMQLRVSSPKARLVMGASLYFAFLLSVVAYFAALGFADELGGLVLWLFLDLGGVGLSGFACLGGVSLIAIWLINAKNRETPSTILLGVSIGLLGPIMFLGYFVAIVVRRLGLNGKYRLIVSGLLGGAALTLITAVSSLALGGYAPALIIPLGFIGIPLLLFSCRSPQERLLVSLSERLLIFVVMLISIGTVWHLASFAQQLA